MQGCVENKASPQVSCIFVLPFLLCVYVCIPIFCIYSSFLLLQKSQPAVPVTGAVTGISSFLLPLVPVEREKLKAAACYLAEQRPEPKGQVRHGSHRSHIRVPVTRRYLTPAMAAWDFLVQSLQNKLYATKVCQHRLPRSEKHVQPS